MRFFQGLLFLVMLSSCAQKVWVNPTSSQYQAQKDLNECKYDSVKYGHVEMWGSGVGAGIEQGLRQNEIVSTCMTSKGYYLTTQGQIDRKIVTQVKPVADYQPNFLCIVNSDCRSGESCRSKKGGGTECRPYN